MGLLIAGSILVIVGFGLWVSMKKKVGQSAHLSSTDTLNVSEIDENYRSITNAVGSGNFTLYCEVKGAAFSENPIKGELSGEEVVYCKSQVIHKFERLESKKDSQGKTQKKWVRHSDIVSTNEQWSDQWGVKDSSGFIQLDSKKSKLDAVQLHSTFEQGELKNNGLKFNVRGISFKESVGASDFRTIGYEYREMGIKLGQSLFVIGDANDRNGTLVISKPEDNQLPFIISTKSEQELQAKMGSAIKGFKIGAFVSFGLGGALLFAGLLKIAGLF